MKFVKLLSIILCFIGFFVLGFSEKAHASLTPPPFPDFPENMESPIYDDYRDISMTENLLGYFGKTTKYFFAIKYHGSRTYSPHFHYKTKEVTLKTRDWTYPYNDPNIGIFVLVYAEDGIYVDDVFQGTGEWIWQPYIIQQGPNSTSVTYGSRFYDIKSQLGCIDDYSGLCISRDYRYEDVVKSSSVLYWGNDGPTDSSWYDGVSYLSGDVFPTSPLFGTIGSEVNYSSRFPYYVIYKPNSVYTGVVALESANKCQLATVSEPNALSQPFICVGEYEVYGLLPNGSKIKYDNGSSFNPPYLWTPNAPTDYCSAIEKSNYNLMSTQGFSLCSASNPAYIDDLIPPYGGVIDFDDTIDLGLLNPLKPVIVWFTNLVNDVAEWFYNLYRNFLILITPDPDIFVWFSGSIKSAMQSKFGNINLSSLEAFKKMNPTTLPDITIPILGGDRTVLNFDAIKWNIDIIRPIAQASVGIFLILFNINQITKAFGDKEATTSA